MNAQLSESNNKLKMENGSMEARKANDETKKGRIKRDMINTIRIILLLYSSHNKEREGPRSPRGHAEREARAMPNFVATFNRKFRLVSFCTLL